MPLISVVIPTYNSEKYIVETLATVFSQTYNDYEVVVSDDGSSDKTVETVKEFFDRYPDKKTRIIINEHEGPGAARNSGIEEAEGKWISFLDSDDKWFPEKLQKVVDFITMEKDVGLLCHSIIWEDCHSETIANSSIYFNYNIPPFLSLYRHNALTTSAVSVKKELLVKAGLMDTTLLSAQDYDLWLRLALIPGIKIRYIEEPLSVWQMKRGGISSNIELRHRSLLRIGRKYSQNLKKISRFPTVERFRFEGRVYAGTGLNLIRSKDYLKGILFLIVGMLKWPRFDWIYKFLFQWKNNRFIINYYLKN